MCLTGASSTLLLISLCASIKATRLPGIQRAILQISAKSNWPVSHLTGGSISSEGWADMWGCTAKSTVWHLSISFPAWDAKGSGRKWTEDHLVNVYICRVPMSWIWCLQRWGASEAFRQGEVMWKNVGWLNIGDAATAFWMRYKGLIAEAGSSSPGGRWQLPGPGVM